MNRLILITLLSLSFIITTTGCKKVSELDNKGVVESFDVIDGSISAGVVLGSPETTIDVQPDNNIIYINIHKGRHISPIQFEAVATINPLAEKILNIDLSEPIIFDEPTDTKLFYVIAASGQAEKWEIRLRFDELDDDAVIKAFRVPILPTGVLISQNPTPNPIDKKIELFYLRGGLPFTIYANIDTGIATSDFKGSLKFNDLTDKQTINVTAPSGYTQAWSVELIKTQNISAIQDPSNTTLSNVSINDYTFKPTVVETDEPLVYQIDSVNATISLFTPLNTMNGKLVDFGITPRNGSEVLGVQTVGYTQWREEKFVYMVDKATAASRAWKIVATYIDQSTIVVNGAKFTSFTADNDIIVNPSSKINLEKKEIVFSTNKDIPNFNVTLEGLKCVVNDGATTTLPQSVTFHSTDEIVNFNITSPDGTKTEQWKLYLHGSMLSDKAELTDFSMSSNVDWQKLYIEKTKKQITILSNQKENITFIPKFTLSKGASISSPNGQIVDNEQSSCVIDVKNKFHVVAEDGISKEEWNIVFIYTPQVAGGDFNESSKVNIGSAGKPEYIYEVKPPWNSANVKSPVKVIGTQVLNRGGVEGDNAVRLTTLNQNTLIWGYVVAAGTTFLGKFELSFNLNGLQHPRTMTKFGMPFSISTLPSSLVLDAKFIPGPKYQQAKYDGSKYVISDLAGVDSSRIFVEMINYTLNGGDITKVPNAYSGDGKNGLGGMAEGVNIVSSSELVIAGENTAFRNWQNNIVIPFKVVDKNKNLPVTHIVMVGSSSKRGDLYIGSIDSELWIDNIHMIYYTPEAGAIEKKK